MQSLAQRLRRAGACEEAIMLIRSPLWHAACVLFLALSSVDCANVEPLGKRYQAPPLGSSWVIARRDAGSYGISSTQLPAKRGEFMWQGKPHVTFENPESTIVAQPDGPWVGIFRGGKPMLTYDPPAGYDFPLTVGKTFTKAYRVTNHATQEVSDLTIKTDVEALEDVVVPAGTFKAFRVKTSDTLGNENTVWFSPELGIFVKQLNRRTEKHAQGVGTRAVELVSQTIKGK
jgi:hypothetical protein